MSLSSRSCVTSQQAGSGGSQASAMGYATYVGRVGALAVALGVGAAVATGCGVAWADPSGSSTSSTGSSPNTPSGVSPSSASTPSPSAGLATSPTVTRINPLVPPAAQSRSRATGLNKANVVASDIARQGGLLVAGTATEPAPPRQPTICSRRRNNSWHRRNRHRTPRRLSRRIPSRPRPRRRKRWKSKARKRFRPARPRATGIRAPRRQPGPCPRPMPWTRRCQHS